MKDGSLRTQILVYQGGRQRWPGRPAIHGAILLSRRRDRSYPLQAGQCHLHKPQFPKIIDEVRRHKTGYVEILATKDSKNIMAYTPILYNTGDYRTHGVFGGVTIAFKVDQYTT